jgi:hypothetical protein
MHTMLETSQHNDLNIKILVSTDTEKLSFPKEMVKKRRRKIKIILHNQMECTTRHDLVTANVCFSKDTKIV